jgi:transmembrane sensor
LAGVLFFCEFTVPRDVNRFQDRISADVPPERGTLDRYLAGETEAEERPRVEQQLGAQGIALVHLFRRELEGSDTTPSVDERAGTFARLKQEIASASAQPASLSKGSRPTSHGGSTRPIQHVIRSRITAAIVMVAAVAAVAMVAVGIATTKETPLGPRPPIRTYTTNAGEIVRVTLPDGSRVTLAPRSQLVVAGDFDRNTRTVMLTGEGYFDVPRSTGAPFVVRAGAIATRVLGTSFDVRYYPGDVSARVIVLHGRVTATNRRITTTLSEGSIAHVTDSTATAVHGDATALAGWTTGQLVFDDTPVSAVLATVGRWYGYEFLIADSALAKRRIAAAFHTNESEKTLAALKHLLKVTMTFDGSRVVVQPKQPQRVPLRRRDSVLVSPISSFEVGK